MRETMDEVQLAELAESIARIGVVEPLVVERAGDRVRVIAGHRRLIACQIVKLDPVPCVVRAPGSVDPAAVTIAENYYREDVNPVEEAAFLDKLLTERCGGDTDVLAALIRHGRGYVEDRLLLLQGDARVLDALRQHKISLAVARELNKYKDSGTRLSHLDAAISGGATAVVVRGWRAQADEFAAYNPAPAAGEPGNSSGQAPAVSAQLRCMFCEETDNPHMMKSVWLHSYCEKVLTRILDHSAEPAPEGKV
jgi:ParB family chromosome partitioning protein